MAPTRAQSLSSPSVSFGVGDFSAVIAKADGGKMMVGAGGWGGEEWSCGHGRG